VSMDTHIYDIQIRVLIYPEEEGFVAHALEMDLVGYGDTQEEAKHELERLVACQISFAVQKREEHLISFPAEQQFFDRWEEAQKKSLLGITADKPLKARAIFITFTKEQIKELKRGKKQFHLVTDAACA
jgi:hypothetical protein